MKHQIGSKVRAGVLACCTALICAAPMVAQDAGTPPPPQGGQGMGGRNPAEMEQRRLEMMTRQLNLTPDQVTQVKAIMDSQNQQMMALRQGGGPAGDARRDQMMQIRQASAAKIRAVLTDDQKPKFDAMEARMQNRQRGNGNQDAPPPPPSA